LDRKYFVVETNFVQSSTYNLKRGTAFSLVGCFLIDSESNILGFYGSIGTFISGNGCLVGANRTELRTHHFLLLLGKGTLLF
jgi:hypothetical protein